MISNDSCRTPFSVPSGLRGRRSKRRGIWLRDRARGIREEWTVPFSFPFALLARPESPSHFLLNACHANLNFRHFNSLQVEYYYGYAMLMSPNKGETAVHDCHCQGDVAVRVREVLARDVSWCICAPCFKFVL